MSLTLPGSLVTTEWLAAHLDAPGLVLLDGSFTMPGVTPTAAENYRERHIPGARFFDIEKVADHASSLPHMLPSAEAFEAVARRLGLSNDSVVVIYDTPGLVSAGRVWWTLRVFGHEKIAVLDGGLRKWRAEGRPVTAEIPTPAEGTFRAAFHPELVRSRADMLQNLGTKAEQVIDARAASRFTAAENEPRPGLRSGHIPGSFNLPSSSLTDPETGEILKPETLKTLFENAGLDLSRPVAATCGSGVTASALAFSLHLIGNDNVAVYDGSWSEWGLPGDTPVATGPSGEEEKAGAGEKA
ncbi:3-mercaptopyruvate sulfurtransferase [Rhizobium sp. S153]|uniref:Sulfurtransferase n=1 Tax=Ciceribacter sichuanensis TaxID=2949647 RepID=A0ABT0VD15_9HYPH|nr:3-mercaptopyruvate sulfurtransferase [Ciceribacter sp. S153]MCM2403683.1 3-mercaptopyruvate sulfurtransferase [Ciceribacter sp. S153]